jgi:hypothetical protein
VVQTPGIPPRRRRNRLNIQQKGRTNGSNVTSHILMGADLFFLPRISTKESVNDIGPNSPEIAILPVQSTQQGSQKGGRR